MKIKIPKSEGISLTADEDKILIKRVFMDETVKNLMYKYSASCRKMVKTGIAALLFLGIVIICVVNRKWIHIAKAAWTGFCVCGGAFFWIRSSKIKIYSELTIKVNRIAESLMLEGFI